MTAYTRRRFMPILIGAPMTSLFAQEGESQETAEMFQVSRVGARGAAETRELLGLIYKDVATKYDTKLREEAAKNNGGQEFKGERIRVIRKLAKNNPNGDLFLCAYAGKPSVVKITGVNLKGGELTPPLANIMAAGEHVTEITRTVVDPAAKKGPEPALQKVNKGGGGVTFFGIPLDTGGGSAPAEEPLGTKQIKETRTLPMFTAEVSTEKLEEGPPPMSQQLFLSMVKNGEVFQYQQFEDRRCQECRGFGKVQDTRPIGMRSPDGKMDCPDCSGTGKIKWDVTYMVGW
ncbi:MAG: hypothetical protein HRU46_13265 [Verrucomicrobiales bacterium]|nr:hypothetical protein [Verrucomicrobiales bacterium]